MLHTGAGVPIASCGLNAAVSEIDIFRELSGGTLLNFDPLSAASIAEAIIKLCNLSEKEKEEQMVARNLILEKVNPSKIAEQLMNAYRG